MLVHDIAEGTLFRANNDRVYESRGNGWYATIHRCDGGPWRDEGISCAETSFPREECHDILVRLGYVPVPGSSRYFCEDMKSTGRIVHVGDPLEDRWQMRVEEGS